jgi:hypothetical protein
MDTLAFIGAILLFFQALLFWTCPVLFQSFRWQRKKNYNVEFNSEYDMERKEDLVGSWIGFGYCRTTVLLTIITAKY